MKFMATLIATAAFTGHPAPPPHTGKPIRPLHSLTAKQADLRARNAMIDYGFQVGMSPDTPEADDLVIDVLIRDKSCRPENRHRLYWDCPYTLRVLDGRKMLHRETGYVVVDSRHAEVFPDV